MRPWMTLALLAACNGGKDTAADDGTPDSPDGGDADTDADSDADTDVPCESTIVAITPAPGADMVPLDTVVTVDFDVPVPASGNYSISVDGGVTGTTTLAGDSLSMTFTPDAPFAPETTYTVDAEVCATTDSADFTTLPEPVDIGLVEGGTYVLDWNDPAVVITDPPGQAGEFLKGLIQIDYVLLQMETIDPITLAADTVATIGGDDGAGNPVPDCAIDIRETADFSLNPFFSFTGDMQIVTDPYATPPETVDVEDFELLARVASDGMSITDVRLSGLVATEQFLNNADCNNAGIQILLGNPGCRPCTISTIAPYECLYFSAEAPIASLDPTLDLAYTCPP